ncbi:MAG: tetratricopeptide repeat protein [Deltaproteobacteria bacterium]|nr:tetratricopeptide repeat protein [Deltaproteobacteria bacterium]
MRNSRLPAWIAPVLALLMTACGGATARRSTAGHDSVSSRHVRIPSQVTDRSLPRLRAQLDGLRADAPERPALRDLLVQYLARRCVESLEAGHPLEGASQFAGALTLYLPADLPGALDPRLVPCAKGVRDALAPVGDEARVMAALGVLHHLHPSDRGVAAERQLLQAWSVESRQSFTNEAERVASLIAVYEDLVALLPLPEVVDRLRGLYVERHVALRRVFSVSQMPPPGSLTREEYRTFVMALGRTAYDMTRLYLRVGQPLRALAALADVRPSGEVDRRILAALRSVEDSPADGYLELAQLFGREDPESALRACRIGREVTPEGPRYALCIGRLLALTGELAGALAAYDEAIEASPGEAELYREALEITEESLRQLLADEDLRGAREAFRKARRFLRDFRRAFPSRDLPVDLAKIELLMGMGEYEAGNIDQAVERLSASVSAKASKEALVQLGVIAERRGNLDEAVRVYRRALDLDLPQREARLDGWWRATILEHVADVHAARNEVSRAQALYSEAIDTWRRTLVSRGSGLSADELASGQLRRGMVLEKLGRRDDALEAFRSAIDARPELRQTYAQLLSYYAADARLNEALQTYRSAINHSSIPEYWKIYYAMWVVATQRRTGDSTETTAIEYLRDVRGDEWQNRLAKFYAGTMPYQSLLATARTAGQRAEAYFYEALNQLAAGRIPEATDLFRQVLATEMMGFFEYDMARRILAQIGSTSAAGAQRAP